GEVDFDQAWQSMVMSSASDAKELNSDASGRAAPRHKKGTDPLVLEAVSREGSAAGIKQQWTFIYSIKNEAWIQFKQVPLGEGYRRFRVIYGNDQQAPRRLEVRLDHANGPLVGTVELPPTDKPRARRIQIYAEATGEISAKAKGTHDVFLVFRADDESSVGEFEYFRFEQYRGAIPLAKNEVKFELRVDSRTGEKIGEFHPRFTGDPAVFSSMVTSLEPVRGTRPLYLVVRSALGKPVGAIDWFSLQKAKQPIDWTGIGAAPRKRWFGGMALPKPTHRPCARPNDKYPKRRRTAGKINLTPRPLFAAEQLAAPPLIDGKLDEWTAPVMTLAESWDGSKSAGQPSTAWIGYDDEALYIAVHNPMKDAKTLDYKNHTWGGTDAMEIAFQDGYASQPGPILNLYGWPDGYFESVEEAGAPAKVAKALGKAVMYKAAVGTDAWTCEWRIPFAATGFTPTTAPMIRLNLGVRKMAEQAWVIWHGAGAATHELDEGGTLIFAAHADALRRIPRDNLEVWLDAADSATIEKDTNGKVSAWKDKSGKGRNAAQPSPACRPAYAPIGLNSKPALQFDEKNATLLELPNLSDERMSGVVFTVFSNPQPGSEKNHDPRIFTASDGKGYDYLVGICATVQGMKTGGPRQRAFPFTNRWAKKVRVGCFSPFNQTYFTGHIAEILVYSGTLTPEAQDRIHAYLTLKWGPWEQE
ncbi:MAG: carbohydrate-binding protein, partial [Lentisphaeria bacterium]|nr:carbohydrate-binding protein [Lentisphaeria bacterium]